LLAIAAVTLLAWLVREYFVLVTVVELPFRGDVRDYVIYAQNMVHSGVFSRSPPIAGVPVPDGFRGPGYPLFLAIGMQLAPRVPDWYALLLQAQAVVGALTVGATVQLARHWLPLSWALLAGLLLALWPHHVAATGALLSEVVFGAALVFTLVCAVRMTRSAGWGWAVATGACAGYAWLVNPVALFVPLLIAFAVWRTARRSALAVMLCVFLVPVVAWSARNALLPGQADRERAAMNLVEGSWPQYHAAWKRQHLDQISIDILQAIDREEAMAKADFPAWVREAHGRMRLDPPYYVRWYVLDKPWLLWDWDIRLGAGGVYFQKVTHSPLETNAILHASTRLLRASNPVVFAFALATGLALAWVAWRGRRPPAPGPTLVAFLFLYVTAVHVVLQAEPRYSIPYRPVELLLAVSGLAALAQRFANRGDAKRHSTGVT
jgi:hypothetical protein